MRRHDRAVAEACGGYIEVVPTQSTENSHVLIVDEEGKLKGKGINRCACMLFGSTRDLIVGTAVLARSEDEEIVGFGEELAKSFCECADELNS